MKRLATILRCGAISLALSIFNLQFSISYAQNLVPRPASVHNTGRVVPLIPYRAIDADRGELVPLAEYLAGVRPGGRVRLTFEGAGTLPAEGYRLTVDEERVTVAGRDYGGVWNGIQTLLQLFPAGIYDGSLAAAQTLPEIAIEDWPAMEYRGVMLDVARTFVPVEDVLRLIDNISRHKINKLHWHLADDEGWRIEIRSWPRLTEIGSWRGGDSPVFAVYGAWDRKYGGYYTRDEIRRVVAYAAVRNVEVIPEIDLPGHSRAAARAYPEILCDNSPSLAVSAGYDIRNVWCVSREENYAMLDDIIAEIAALFPSTTIHLGGDEVMTGQWRECPHCKDLMEERGITDPAALQEVFMARVIEIAARHGRTAGVWNEAAASGAIPRSTTVWGWENTAAARRVAGIGYPVVFCAGEYFYFDQRQGPRDRGHIWAGVVPLEKVYSFSPAAVGFSPAEAANVVGVEGTFFGELLLENGPEFLDYQLFPRVCALAEVGWTSAADRRWDEFEQRLKQSANGAPSHFERLTAMGIAFRRAAPSPTPAAVLKTPAATLTGSLPENEKYPFNGAANYKTAARMTRAPIDGDWLQWTFAAPLSASSIDIRTGYDHLQRAGFPTGRIEVSYNGTVWETVATLHDLRATVTLDPTRPIQALRIVNTSNGNGENFTIIQSLKIK